jgi:hypothetical protein
MNTTRLQGPVGALLGFRRSWCLCVVGLVCCDATGCYEARAQLAITEAMSTASTNCGGAWIPANADFWELTNFGTNALPLADYLFADHDRAFPEGAWRIVDSNGHGISIGPGESIIFVRSDHGTADQAAFRAWWGEANLPANLRIYFYPGAGFGFDDMGDAVRLWDANSNLVDEAAFGDARQGSTFTYDSATGEFGQFSTNGACGAFTAVTCDIGSPGFAPCGPVPIRITQQPVSQTAEAGSDATFRVQAFGLPHPRYQWYFNGNPISNATAVTDAIPLLVNFAGCGLAWTVNAGLADLTLPKVQPSHAGQYFVEVFNGLEKLTSAVVTLTVNTSPTPVRVECPPPWACAPVGNDFSSTNLVISPGQTATLAVHARGYPLPTFQWSRSTGGMSFFDLVDETNRTLTLSNVQAADAGANRVRVENPVNATYAFATLSVQRSPRLKITEAMPAPCAGLDKNWWELTNTDETSVNLCGYRWDDWPGNIGGGPTITNDVIVKPGESIVFLESQTPASFIARWGADNLPPHLQFITYRANGLSALGDEVNIWNPTATEDTDSIDSVGFSTAAPGASFWFDSDHLCSEFGTVSVEGECGAIRAAIGCEVGSPGWTRWTPPCVTDIRHNGSSVTLWWKAQPGSTNLVQFTRRLTESTNASEWTDLGTYSFPGTSGTIIDATIGADPQRFYRVVMTSPAPCYCVEEP